MKKLMVFTVCAVLLMTNFGCKLSESSGSNSVPSSHDHSTQIFTDIIAEYEKLVEYRLSSSFEEDWNASEKFTISQILQNAAKDIDADFSSQGVALEDKWSYMIVEMTNAIPNPTKNDYGYFLRDINCDGNSELFWVRSDGKLLAIFAEKQGTGILIDAYYSQYQGVITREDYIHTVSSHGALTAYHDVKELGDDGLFHNIKSYGAEEDSACDGVKYYEYLQTKTTVDAQRFAQLQEEYPFNHGVDYLEKVIWFR